MNKTKKIEVRVTLFEQKILKAKARSLGISLSHYMRSSALNKRTPKQLDPLELEAYRDLKKYYNHFSSISNLFKNGNTPKMIEEIEALKSQLKEHLNYIKNGQ